jgi:hypothetical protein
MTQKIPTAETDQARMIERPDGYYWQDIDSGKLYGPFTSLNEAQADMLYRDDSDYEEGESLQEAEEEIGISDWTDPDSDGPAEGTSPRFSDDQ